MVGKDIQLIRKARGKAQNLLAKEVGISNTFLSAIEHDRRTPSMSVLYRICEKLNSELRILTKT